MKKQLTFMLLFWIAVSGNAFSQTSIGGDNAYYAEELYDPAYPMMKEWAKAGVEGGIPSRDKQSVRLRIQPPADLISAVKKLQKEGGGVLLLDSGTYDLKQTLRIPSDVTIRGVHKDQVEIRVDMHGYHFKTKKPLTAALSLDGVERVGIEDLTIRYVTPPFEPVDKQHVYDAWERKIFHEREMRDTTLFVEMIWINNSKNCWVDNCNILWSGSDAIRINLSEHITCRHNYIDRTYNKCDGGMGYYNIMRSKYILSCYEKVRRIRHYAIHINSAYCVAIHNDFEVDVNFHSGDDGYNLIEDNRVIIPVWHSWHCFQLGDPSQHKSAGAWNILFNNQTYHKLNGPEFSDHNVVYKMSEKFGGPSVIKTELPVPQGGTFYPVKVKN
ncbi:MAG: right-handed parallel beta-helix repeat-containing protein [Tannerella sp.]|jgi:hypothetical protein|nr:right-handed parallel beta-helix repeat-containing protein [Tannerella sp.]